jgi:beta-aspartyl-dipeptidase (metallo-type)
VFTILQNGEVYAPEPQGRKSVLLIGDRIARIADAGDAAGIDVRAVEALGLPVEVIDAAGCIVTPGAIDPHMHLLGGSGEEGFASRGPDLQWSEIVPCGTTTVVGLLGVDATTRTLPDLLAKVRGLEENGITGFCYTGHYGLPAVTFTGSVRDDLILIDKVIGVGEIALSDHRASQPEPHELARMAVDAHVGGILSGKAGIIHFHLGEGRGRLAPLRALLDAEEIPPECLYPTHVERSSELVAEAAELTRRGCFVDMDTAEPGIEKWVAVFLEKGGDPERLTLSTDSDSSAPKTLFEELRKVVEKRRLPLARALALVTANTASVLHLEGKGRLEPGRDADLLVLGEKSLEVRHVVARGKLLVRDGELLVRERFLEKSKREIHLVGRG